MDSEQWNSAVESRDDLKRKKRKAVIDAGARLFIEKGFEKTSLDDLAKSLKITKRTIYYYVISKDEILMEIIRQSMTVLGRIANTPDHKPQSAVKQIEEIIDDYSRWITTDFGACLVLTRENMLTEEVRLELRSRKNRLDHMIRDAVLRGIETGEIRPDCDPRLTSAAIYGALNWVPFWNKGGAITSAEKIAEQYKTIFTKGLKP